MANQTKDKGETKSEYAGQAEALKACVEALGPLGERQRARVVAALAELYR